MSILNSLQITSTFRMLTILMLSSLALTSCGGGGSKVSRSIDLMDLPSNHGISAGSFTVEPGSSMKHGNVTVTCPAGGSACMVTVGADGSVSYAESGGMPTIAPSLAEIMDIPSDHGITVGEFTVAPGSTDQHGTVRVSCPAGISACMVTVAANGDVNYVKTGGIPTFVSIYPLQYIEPGLNRSRQEPVYSTAARDNRLSVSLPNPQNVFSALSTSIDRFFDENDVDHSKTGIKSIRSDGDEGFYVTFVVDGETSTEEWVTRFDKSDFESYAADGFERASVSEVQPDLLWIYSLTNSFTPANVTRGSTEFKYFDANACRYGFTTNSE